MTYKQLLNSLTKEQLDEEIYVFEPYECVYIKVENLEVVKEDEETLEKGKVFLRLEVEPADM